jgi:thiol-disulfide isomerase/thioredoxin
MFTLHSLTQTRASLSGICLLLACSGGCRPPAAQENAESQPVASNASSTQAKRDVTLIEGEAASRPGITSDPPAAPQTTPLQPVSQSSRAPDASKPKPVEKAITQPVAPSGTESTAREPASENATTAANEKAAEPAKRPSVPADFDSADAIRQILDLLNERPSIRKSPGFADSVCELADQVLASGAKPEHKITALLSKFKILHETAVDGDQKAEAKLRELAKQHASHASEKVTAFVRMVEMEQRLMAIEKAPAAEVEKLIGDLKAYLAKERLLDRHLRMASLSVDLVNKLDEKQREPRLKELGELYAKSPDLDLASYGQRLSGKVVGDAADSLAGKPLELVGTTALGAPFKWDGYRDRIVIVDFWATWCGPCRKELPHLREVSDRFRRDGLEVVGVSLDNDMDALRKFLDDQPLPWVTLAGRSNQDLALKYGVAAIPTMFLVDKEGKIVARANRIGQLVPHIETLLKVKPTPPVKSE